MVNASLRSYIVHHDQSGLSRPNFMGNGDNNNDNIHNISNLGDKRSKHVSDKAIMTIFKHHGILMGPMPMELHGG
jgi:hypothetical protein